MIRTFVAWCTLAAVLCLTVTAHAQEGKSPTKAKAPAEKGQKIDVEKLRSEYWATGEKDDMAVVQNRQYSKSRRLEVSLMGGTVSSDPFLSVRTLGARIGYYFSETLAVEAIGWKAFSNNSSAFDALQQNQGLTVKTNPPRWFAGAGVDFCPIYGKLSLLGSSILHFDLGLRAGLGLTSTDTGDYISPYIGIGQRLYLTQTFSLTFDYKLIYYKEQVPENTAVGAPPSFAERSNFSNALLLGVGFLF